MAYDDSVDHHRFLRVVYDERSAKALHALSGRGMPTIERLHHIISLDHPGGHVINDFDQQTSQSSPRESALVLSHSLLPPPTNRVVFVCGAPESGKTTSSLAWLAAHPDDIAHVSCFFPKATLESNRRRLTLLDGINSSAFEFTTVEAIEEHISQVSKRYGLQKDGADKVQVILLDDTTGLDSSEFQMNKRFVSMLTTYPQHHRVCFILITHQFRNRLPAVRQSVWSMWLFGYVDTIRQNTAEIGSIFPLASQYLEENGNRTIMGLAAFRDSANLEAVGHKPPTDTLLYVLDEPESYINSHYLHVKEEQPEGDKSNDHPLAWHQVDALVSNSLDRGTLQCIANLAE